MRADCARFCRPRRRAAWPMLRRNAVFSTRSQASPLSCRSCRTLTRKAMALLLAVATACPIVAPSRLFASTNTLTDVDQALAALAELQKPSDAELLQQGMEQYNQGKYEE